MSLDEGQRFEAKRLAALHATGLVGSPSESDFDDLARLTARVCETPIAYISLIDETTQWIKAGVGIDVGALHREGSICLNTLEAGDLLVIEDMQADPRSKDHPLISSHGLRFYAGAPLSDAGGHALGTLCALDSRVRRVDAPFRDSLRILARQVVAQIELRSAQRAHDDALAVANAHSAELERALDVEHTLTLEIDHRVKNSLQLVGSLLQMQAARSDRREVRDALQTARSRVTAISTIHGALNRSASINLVSVPLYLDKLVADLRESAPEGIAITIAADDATLGTSQASSLAILINEFVTNSLKYAFPDGKGGTVRLSLRSDGRRIWADFADDGIGHAAQGGGTTREGLGTRIMQAVGQQLGAVLAFRAGPEGTSLRFDFPLDPAEAL